jgi:uncharacterized protein with HEPN domain
MTGPHDARKRDLVKCEDMRLHAERARRFLGTLSFEEFQADDMVQSAVVRCVEVIGEAARLVSEETRRRAPTIPWPLIVGMRHILAHDYGVVNLDKVYDVVTCHLGPLIADLEQLIRVLEPEVGWTKEDDS